MRLRRGIQVAVKHFGRTGRVVGYSDTSNQVANGKGDPVVASFRIAAG